MKLKFAVTTLITALFLSESAAALSCMRPDLAQTMERAKASDQTYYVLVGKFRTAPPLRHPKDHYRRGHGKPGGNNDYNNPTPPPITRASFEGFSLGRHRGADVPLSRFPVDIKVTCMASWCGSAPPSDVEMIAFVEAPRGRTPILHMSACPGNTFNISRGDGQVRKMRTCLDNTCVSDQPPYGR